MNKLRAAKVLVVGLGGVGGAAAEVLARSGVGSLCLVDGDVFEPSNLNRQLFCTASAVGRSKAAEAKARIDSLGLMTEVVGDDRFVDESNVVEIVAGGYDYCVDAIDDIKNKLLLIAECKRMGVRVVSAMGAGNRLSCDFAVMSVFDTKDDPFARKIRHELRVSGIDELDVVCATSPPTVKIGTPASIAAPPLVMGAVLANYVVTELIA